MPSPQAAMSDQGHFQPQALPPLEIDPGLIRDPRLLSVARGLARGRRLELEDGLALMETTDILGLGAMADAARRAKNQDRAYYVVNRHLNYSNVCVNKCSFCAFWKEAHAGDAYVMTPAEVAAKAGEDPGLRIDEFHIVGSCHPELPLDYYLELLSAVKAARPGAALKAFTPVEIDHMARQAGLGVDRVLALLKQRGLVGLPGGGAEIFSPSTRSRICPDKISGQRWLEVAGRAHRLGLYSNATMLYGHLESARERVEHLLALRRQQDQTGGFTAFIPLAFHPANTRLQDQVAPTTGLDDLRVIAASRLLLDNFPHIKAYWVMLGEKLAQVALWFGADDLDGTIIEERITHSAGATTARGITEGRLRRLISAAGFRPVRRDSFYQPVDRSDVA